MGPGTPYSTLYIDNTAPTHGDGSCPYDTGRSSGSRIGLPVAPSHPLRTVASATFVPGHSGGTATDSHRLPSWLSRSRPCIRMISSMGPEG